MYLTTEKRFCIQMSYRILYTIFTFKTVFLILFVHVKCNPCAKYMTIIISIKLIFILVPIPEYIFHNLSRFIKTLLYDETIRDKNVSLHFNQI